MTPWTVARQLRCPWGFPGKESWSGLPFPSPGELPNPGIKPRSFTLQVDSLPSDPPGKPPLMSPQITSPWLFLVLLFESTKMAVSLEGRDICIYTELIRTARCNAETNIAL